jgi:hypothetical protein
MEGNVIEEQRERQRVNFQSTIEIDTETGKLFFEALDDISMGGFSIKTADPFIKDKEYNFNLKLTSGIKEIVILGKCTPVRFSHSLDKEESDQEKEVGFKITYLEPEGSRELYNVIKYNKLD